MAGLLSVPIIGIVENMSYFVCPNCNEKHYIFGKSKVEEEANKYGIKHTATLPINPSLAQNVMKVVLKLLKAIFKFFR